MRKDKTMKLNLLFIVMDLFTLLAYPIVYAYEKLRLFAKSKESIASGETIRSRFSYTGQMTNTNV